MSTNQPLILIIDDDEAFSEIFGIKLSSAGFRVETASGGEEGIRKAKALKPNLILLDMRMPIMNGAETLVKIKDDPEAKDFRVVFITSLGTPWEETELFCNKISKECGAVGYIRKTENLDVFEDKVKTFLQ